MRAIYPSDPVNSTSSRAHPPRPTLQALRHDLSRYRRVARKRISTRIASPPPSARQWHILPRNARPLLPLANTTGAASTAPRRSTEACGPTFTVRQMTRCGRRFRRRKADFARSLLPSVPARLRDAAAMVTIRGRASSADGAAVSRASSAGAKVAAAA